MSELTRPSPTTAPKRIEREALARAMADKLMAWKLPDNFGPDCYISFNREQASKTNATWPTGTNLFTHEQAVSMLLDIMPAQSECRTCDGDGWTEQGDPEIGSAKFDCPTCNGSGGALAAPPAPAPTEAVGWVKAVQAFADELELPFLEAKSFLDEVFPQWMADKEAAGFVTLRRDDLIEGDSYGVDGSDFYRCRICHAESGAGMLNNGIKHDHDCPLAAAPTTEATSSSDAERLDAARYRWLRENNAYSIHDRLFADCPMHKFNDAMLDAAIDAAFANKGGKL